MKPRAPRASAFLRSVRQARIGMALRQRWRPLSIWNTHINGLFRRERAYNEYLLERMMAEDKHKARCSAHLGREQP